MDDSARVSREGRVVAGRGRLERRLFGWMAALALVPACILVLLGVWGWTSSLGRVATLGPWEGIAESGRLVFEAAESAAESDPVLAEALARHREALSASLVLARRWEFLGQRIVAVIPFVALVLAGTLGWVALVASRRVARELARPIGELVDWAGRLARSEPLPPGGPGEALEVEEVQVLRAAFRRAEVELAAARERLLQAERIRVWGEMARRVAHEMKNPLTPLRLAAHRLMRSTLAADELAEPVAVIVEETERLEELAREFAALGRPADGPTSMIELQELVAGLLRTDVPPRVEASLDAPEQPILVEGHYEPLRRAFRNLIRNAVEAMEGMDGPRRLDVRLAVGAAGGGDRVEVVIADVGPGLPEGLGDRVFEPDFTTKSRGTGLGLALARQAVVAHGGQIEARPRAGGGAEFVVRLPALAGSAAGT